MSLDVTILGADGKPGETVSLGVDNHAELIRASKRLDLRLLSRLEDYYEDVEFEPEEAAALEAECERLALASGDVPELLRLANDLAALSRSAFLGKVAILALAD